MTSDELILRAEQAQRILNDPLISEAFETLEKDVAEAWASSAVRDKEGQNELLLMMKTARKFRAIFTALVMTGEVEKSKLKTPQLTRVLERFGVYN
jgi:hypothetical protein